MALLATLFASRGTVMLTAGDEFGRTQQGNNNAYAQDNGITWLDWTSRDRLREDYMAALADLRKRFPALRSTGFLNGASRDGLRDVEWLTETGEGMGQGDWENAERRRLTMVLAAGDRRLTRIAVAINGDRRAAIFALPRRAGRSWRVLLSPPENAPRQVEDGAFLVQGRTVLFLEERRD